MASSVFVEKFVQPSVDAGPVSYAAIDLDHFKQVNDDFGFEAGDAILASVTKTLEANLPTSAVVTRKGGDEFAVLFPGAAPEDALILLEEVRAHFSAKPPIPRVTRPVDMRIGIAGAPVHASDARTLISAADEAMHRAKAQGTKVAIHVEERMVLKSNYYPKGRLARLAGLSDRTGRTEASLLREALDALLEKYTKL